VSHRTSEISLFTEAGDKQNFSIIPDISACEFSLTVEYYFQNCDVINKQVRYNIHPHNTIKSVRDSMRTTKHKLHT
jgi:hypothetical protein